jgi:hypothetical protein
MKSEYLPEGITGYPQKVSETLISKVKQHVVIDKVSKLLWL